MGAISTPQRVAHEVEIIQMIPNSRAIIHKALRVYRQSPARLWHNGEAFMRKPCPIKSWAWVNLAPCSQIRMADNAFGRNIPTGHDPAQQITEAGHLWFGKRAKSAIVQFNSDGVGIYVHDPAPSPRARMPCPHRLIHQSVASAITPNKIMRRNLAGWVAERARCPLAILHRGIMDHDQRGG